MASHDVRERQVPVAAALGLVSAWLLVSMAFWGLAIYPLAADAPAWLVQTRYVCFGAPPGGLPDGGGWITLIAGPLLLLVAIAVTFSGELVAGLRWLAAQRLWRVIAIMLVAGFVAELAWAAREVRRVYVSGTQSFDASEPQGLPTDLERGTRPAPDFALVDQRGDAVSLAALRGKTVILTFAFAHCATVCPGLVAQVKRALAQTDRDTTRAVLITLDPWRDTPSALPTLAQRWALPDEALLLSGPVAEVVRTLDAYAVPYKRDEATGDVQHPALVCVLDAEGRIAFVFNNPPVDWLVSAVARLDGHRS